MLNIFGTDYCGDITLPAICENQSEVLTPLKSQVAGILVLPKGVAGPSSWISSDAWEGVIDNTDTDNAAAKLLTGSGEIPEAEETVARLGKTYEKVVQRVYQLNFDISIREDSNYFFMQKFQQGFRAFNFWILTLGGRILGGQNGIAPDFVTATAPYGGSRSDVERGILKIRWKADIDPSRAYLPELLELGSSFVVTPGGSNVAYFHQGFASQASANLTWTANSGALPTTNTKAQIMVFQRGQKLEEVAQYSISHNTGPGESTITINANTHFSGADYEVIAITTT